MSGHGRGKGNPQLRVKGGMKGSSGAFQPSAVRAARVTPGGAQNARAPGGRGARGPCFGHGPEPIVAPLRFTVGRGLPPSKGFIPPRTAQAKGQHDRNRDDHREKPNLRPWHEDGHHPRHAQHPNRRPCCQQATHRRPPERSLQIEKAAFGNHFRMPRQPRHERPVTQRRAQPDHRLDRSQRLSRKHDQQGSKPPDSHAETWQTWTARTQ